MIYAGSIGTQIANELIDSYRWAVCIKLTRNGCIPSQFVLDGKKLCKMGLRLVWTGLHGVIYIKSNTLNVKHKQSAKSWRIVKINILKNHFVSCCVPTCRWAGWTPLHPVELPVRLVHPRRKVHWFPNKPAGVWVTFVWVQLSYFERNLLLYMKSRHVSLSLGLLIKTLQRHQLSLLFCFFYFQFCWNDEVESV